MKKYIISLFGILLLVAFLAVLQERPYKESAPLIAKIVQQANAKVDTVKKK